MRRRYEWLSLRLAQYLGHCRVRVFDPFHADAAGVRAYDIGGKDSWTYTCQRLLEEKLDSAKHAQVLRTHDEATAQTYIAQPGAVDAARVLGIDPDREINRYALSPTMFHGGMIANSQRRFCQKRL
jgi:hypothetical protein